MVSAVDGVRAFTFFDLVARRSKIVPIPDPVALKVSEVDNKLQEVSGVYFTEGTETTAAVIELLFNWDIVKFNYRPVLRFKFASISCLSPGKPLLIEQNLDLNMKQLDNVS